MIIQFKILHFILVLSLLSLGISGCGGGIKSEITYGGQKDQPSEVIANNPPCPNNFVTSGPCIVEKAGVTITDTYGSSLTQWNNATASTVVTANIPNAFYANQQVQFTESNLVSENIRSGISIFGVTGNLSSSYSACSEDSGTLNLSSCSTSANRYVASIAGSNITIWDNSDNNTSVTATIPNGYYNSRTISFTDADLLASNIRSGINIFGVTGTLTPSYSACSEDSGTLNLSSCSTSANRYVASVAGSNITIWDNSDNNTSVTAPIPNGYYNSRTITFTDADLLASNIINGVNIFGVTGSATSAYSSCSDNVLNASQCSTVANRYVYTTENGGRSANCSAGFNGGACWTNSSNQYVTSSLGGNITSWSNTTSATTIDGTIPLGYYPGNTIAFTDSDLVASNIKAGVSIFNVTGSYNGATAPSNMHRDRTTTQISQLMESVTNAGGAYPNNNPGYRAVPRISKDDDGTAGGSAVYVSRTGWETQCDSVTGAGGGSANSVCKCGLSGTIDDRIADCASHSIIGTEATWDGATKGNAGQGVWKLVTRTNSDSASKGREVWRDEQTKLLWSSIISTGLNWCKATGSNFITNNPSAENDPNDYCDNATYQTTGTWSAGTNKAISACFEDIDDDGASDYFTTTDGSIAPCLSGRCSLSLV